MPAPRFIQAQEGNNWMGETLKGFVEGTHENFKKDRESDALKSIYQQHDRDGQNLEKTIREIQTRPGISPSTRVSTINQLMDFNKQNGEFKKKAKEDMDKSNQVREIENQRGLQPGSLKGFDSNPALANQVTKPQKGAQSDQPIEDDQLRRIQHVESQPGFEEASLPDKARLLRNAKVSGTNSERVLKPYNEVEKIDNERGKIVRQEQAKKDIGFADDQANKTKELFSRQQTIDQAEKLNEEGVTGGLWDRAMQEAGLIQYTSDGYRVFSSIAKDAVKNQNIKSVIGSQISQMEFRFFQEATINPNFSKEANNQILKKERLALRYEKLYADITNNLIEQNGGEIPERLQQRVNEQFAKQSPKISKEVKEAAIDFEAIQNVPEGKVLMYDKKRRPMHVPANEVEKATKMGASLS